MRIFRAGWGSFALTSILKDNTWETMGDSAMEIENLSICGDDLETEPLVESIADAPPNHDNTSVIATNQDSETSIQQPSQSQETAAPAVNNDHMLVQTGTRTTSASARSEITEATSPNAASRRERMMSVTEPAGNDSNQTTSIVVPASVQRSLTEPENTTRDSGAALTVVNSQDSIQRQERLIEEPPPLYSNLFSASYIHNATNNSRHAQLQDNFSNEQHNRLPSTVPRHSVCQNHFLHHCSSCYPPPFPHSSHHMSILLPGEIGQHPSHDRTLRQIAPQHTTVLPVHNRGGSEQDREDYLKFSFICVILCSFHLNLPALLCVLPALAYSIKARHLNVEGRYREARKCSRAALTCNIIASFQYLIVVLVSAVIVLHIIAL